MREYKLVFCICSSTNFIRLRNFYRAARAAHKVVLASGYMLKQVQSYYQYKLDLYAYLNNCKQDREFRLSGMYSLLLDKEGRIDRLFVRSASYPNWPALTVAVQGDIIPDFPLINKSFELCYACIDR